MKFVSLALAAAGVALASPVVSQNPDTDSEQAPEERSEQSDEAEEAAEPKKICRSIRTDASSRRKQRVCMTKDQWRAYNRGQ